MSALQALVEAFAEQARHDLAETVEAQRREHHELRQTDPKYAELAARVDHHRAGSKGAVAGLKAVGAAICEDLAESLKRERQAREHEARRRMVAMTAPRRTRGCARGRERRSARGRTSGTRAGPDSDSDSGSSEPPGEPGRLTFGGVA
jgi:hypothetical protein